jgi:hypothetical protein
VSDAFGGRATDLEGIAEWYRLFSRHECRGRSPLYERLAAEVADDAGLLALIAEVPTPQRQPNLWLAATQYLVGPEGMPPDGAALWALWSDRRTELLELVRSRRTQTNEVGRCAVLVPAFSTVDGPLALLEVGASGGLNLLLDRYRYRWSDGVELGGADATVTIDCGLRGPLRPARRLPDVCWRRGLDVAPVFLGDDEVRWLAACVWPDQPERRARLLAAVEVARRDPPPVVRGDLVDDLASVAASAPEDATLVVFHSAVVSYVDAAKRAAFVEVLAALARDRPVVRVAYEGRGVVDAHEGLLGETGRDDVTFVLGTTTFDGGRPVDQLLALADPHGAELEWLDGDAP